MEGARRPGQLKDWLKEALLRGDNASIEWSADGAAWHHSDGGRREVGASLEGVKLDFGLSCGVHLRRCTPNAVRCKDQLLCRFCTPEKLLKRARRDRPSSNERVAYATFTSLRPARQWRWQVCPPLDHPPVDFWHEAADVYVQVDGKQHFSGGMHGVPAAAQQAADLRSIEALWEAGAALVRVHHADLAGGAATGPAAVVVQAALAFKEAGRQGALLAFTPSYNPGPAVAAGRMLDPWYWLNHLAEVLPMARRIMRADGSVWFIQQAQRTM